MKTILYLQYADPAAYPPLERGAWQLLDRGWRVHFLGVALTGDVSRLRLAPHPNLTVRLLPPSTGSTGRIGPFGRFMAAALREIAAVRPDVVYCSDHRSYPAGVVASLIPGMTTVLHEHDSPRQGDAGDIRPLLATRILFARRASVCVVPQDARAKTFAQATGAKKVVVAYNCPALREIGPAPRQRPRHGLVLWHHGSIGPGRLPMTIIDALALVPPDVELRFAGYETGGARGHIDALMRRAAELGISERVTYLGALATREQLYSAASDADVGVVLFVTKFTEPMVGASNKPFDFLACGLPLITNNTHEWQDFYGAAGVSMGCDPQSPGDIATAIRWYRDHPEERRQMARAGHALIKERWNYEQTFAPVLWTLSRDPHARKTA